jgi:molybdate transport system ATP-binding protein
MTLSVSLQHKFEGLNLDVGFEAPNGITVLFGRSGSGKSTVVNAVAGLFRPDAASISIDGRVLHESAQGIFCPPHKRGVGYIFQDHRLFPHLNVAQNLRYGQRGQKGQQRQEAAQAFEMICDLLGLTDLLSRRPIGLSGGEAQRVSIGRALLAQPKILLADEPLAALDEGRKSEIMPYFERIRDEMDVPILYVSHSASEVARLATTVVALEKGRVVRQGPALDVLADPQISPAGAAAVGAAFDTRITRHHEDGLTELSAGGVALFLPRVAASVGQSVRVRLPASDVLLSRGKPEGLSALNVLEGTVSSILSVDEAAALVSVSTVAGTVLARVTRRSVSALGLEDGVACYAIVKTIAIASAHAP